MVEKFLRVHFLITRKAILTIELIRFVIFTIIMLEDKLVNILKKIIWGKRRLLGSYSDPWSGVI